MAPAPSWRAAPEAHVGIDTSDTNTDRADRDGRTEGAHPGRRPRPHEDGRGHLREWPTSDYTSSQELRARVTPTKAETRACSFHRSTLNGGTSGGK
jgi:hypothetical protein